MLEHDASESGETSDAVLAQLETFEVTKSCYFPVNF